MVCLSQPCLSSFLSCWVGVSSCRVVWVQQSAFSSASAHICRSSAIATSACSCCMSCAICAYVSALRLSNGELKRSSFSGAGASEGVLSAGCAVADAVFSFSFPPFPLCLSASAALFLSEDAPVLSCAAEVSVWSVRMGLTVMPSDESTAAECVWREEDACSISACTEETKMNHTTPVSSPLCTTHKTHTMQLHSGGEMSIIIIIIIFICTFIFIFIIIFILSIHCVIKVWSRIINNSSFSSPQKLIYRSFYN